MPQLKINIILLELETLYKLLMVFNSLGTDRQ